MYKWFNVHLLMQSEGENRILNWNPTILRVGAGEAQGSELGSKGWHSFHILLFWNFCRKPKSAVSHVHKHTQDPPLGLLWRRCLCHVLLIKVWWFLFLFLCETQTHMDGHWADMVNAATTSLTLGIWALYLNWSIINYIGSLLIC